MTESELRDLIEALLPHVESLTGLPSRWNGQVHFTDAVNVRGEPAYLAKKDWSCSITVHVERANSSRLFETLIHEAFHSVSAGLTFSAFQKFPGFEEGVVEWLTRRFGPQIAQEMNRTASFQRDVFERALAALNALWMLTNRLEEEFYLGLLRTPLAQRQESVVQWVGEADPLQSRARILARISLLLRQLRGE